MQQAEAALLQGKANETLARANAGRYQNLFQRGVVSRQENETYQAQYAAQQANVQALDKAANATRSNVTAGEANLARLNQLKTYQTVRAPFDGVITVRNVDTGALVNEGSTLLFRLAQTGSLRTYVNLPQSDAESVKVGQRATVTIAEVPGRKFNGAVTRTANALDPATRTLLTEVQIANLDGRLMPGMYAQVDLSLPRKDPPLVIPGDTLIVRSDGPQVAAVAADDTVHFARIQLGRDYGDRIEVVSAASKTALASSSTPATPFARASRSNPRPRRNSAMTELRKPGRTGVPACTASAARLLLALLCGALAQARTPPPLRTENSPRFHELLRAGNLYLSLQDALALAIENNLDIELQRYNLPSPISISSAPAAAASARGLNYTIFDAPTGTGGPV